MSDERVAVPLEEALERLEVIPDYDNGRGPQPCVHTFRSSRGMIIGAHWTLEDLRAAMEAHGVEEAGPMALGMGHDLVLIDDIGPLFIETKAGS